MQVQSLVRELRPHTSRNAAKIIKNKKIKKGEVQVPKSQKNPTPRVMVKPPGPKGPETCCGATLDQEIRDHTWNREATTSQCGLA